MTNPTVSDALSSTGGLSEVRTMDVSPLVTIGIPTYNREGMLQRAIGSALAQTYRPLRIIVSDNASTDGTEELMRRLASAEHRVIYRRNSENIGPTANFLRVLDAALGKYFMWLADDDWLSPDYVRNCVAELESDPRVALAAGVPIYHSDSTPGVAGVCVNVTGEDPCHRVVDFFRQVSDNGTFYGVFPLATLRRTPPLRARVGGDWLLLGEIAALGEIHTVSSVEVHRNVRHDRGFEQIAEAVGLTKFEGKHPHLAIAGLILWEASESPIICSLGIRRFSVVAKSAAIIFVRYVAPREIAPGRRWRSLKRRMGRTSTVTNVRRSRLRIAAAMARVGRDVRAEK